MAEQTPQPSNSEKSNDSMPNNMLGGASTISGSVIGMTLLGYYLDHKFGWQPWGVLCGGLLGVAIGMWELWKMMFSRKSSR